MFPQPLLTWSAGMRGQTRCSVGETKSPSALIPGHRGNHLRQLAVLLSSSRVGAMANVTRPTSSTCNITGLLHRVNRDGLGGLDQSKF